MELSLSKKLAYFKYHTESLFFNRRYSQFYADHCRNFRTFCLFIGFGRTGSSLLGALLNAHPDIAMEHEAFFLRQVERVAKPAFSAKRRRQFIFLPRKFAPDQLAYPLSRDGALGYLMHSAQLKEGAKGFQQFGYDYAVPTVADWPAGGPALIGDKSGRITGEAIRQKGFDWLSEFTASWRLHLAFINLTRNPYDVLTTLCIREFGSLYQIRSMNARDTAKFAIEKTAPSEFQRLLGEWMPKFIQRLDAVQSVIQTLIDSKQYPIKTVRYEDLAEDPTGNLTALLDFLGVPASEPYLAACKSIVKPASVSRHYLGDIWHDKSAVQELTQQYECLRGYQYDS